MKIPSKISGLQRFLEFMIEGVEWNSQCEFFGTTEHVTKSTGTQRRHNDGRDRKWDVREDVNLLNEFFCQEKEHRVGQVSVTEGHGSDVGRVLKEKYKPTDRAPRPRFFGTDHCFQDCGEVDGNERE